jgi:hypothetical protein
VLDPQLPRERDAPRPRRRILGIVDDLDLFGLTLGVVLDDQLQRIEDRHPTGRPAVEHPAHGMLELTDLDDAVRARNADHRGEVPDALRREAPPPEAADRRHPRVVPAAHVALVHEPLQHALRQHGMREVESRELDLARP